MAESRQRQKTNKQAVLMIHGIGEQIPMTTLRSFVKTVWTDDQSQRDTNDGGDLFSGPDRVSGSLELRRLITSDNKNDVRTDFFEFYWAHKVSDTKKWQVLKWIGGLLGRYPNSSTASTRFAWIAAYIVTVLSLSLSIILLAYFLLNGIPIFQHFGWLAIVAPIVGGGFINAVLLRTVGDAARYLTPAPYNIKNRHEIRNAGVEILKGLIEMKDGLNRQKYDRIIVVGHSLGAIIGYDILRGAWPHYNVKAQDRDSRTTALETIEDAGKDGHVDSLSYRNLQKACLEELRDNGSAWSVSDFVTLGSPLTHAAWLMAESDEDFARKKSEREFPQCPPYPNGNRERGRFSYSVRRRIESDDSEDVVEYMAQIPDHSAVFGPVRWTNVYFHSSWALHGDIISGPAANLFGPGIVDIKAPHPKHNFGFFSHLRYWKVDKRPRRDGDHIDCLNASVNLLDEDNPFEKVSAFVQKP